MLVGIAIDKGLIESVRQPVVSLLPAAVRGKPDAQRQAMTVESLLTMTSGLDCGFEPGERELAAMRRSDNWPAFALALPMRAPPGTQYAYCSCNNHLLSAILSARTGGSALAFARTHLFDPLGISTASWPADSHGRSHGWGDLHLFPKDLAKIGELYRNGGTWKGRRILSESWVRQSTRPLVRVRDGVGYGYSWWINTARTPAIYEAVGRGGQRVAVVPDKELVIVFNGGGVDTDAIAPLLFRALRSDQAMAVRAGGPERLAAAMVAARQPPAVGPPPAMPSLARTISGTTYVADDNPLGLRTLSLQFSGDRDRANAALEFLGREWNVPLGLRGRPMISTSTPTGTPAAISGRWVSDREFVLDLDTIAEVNHFVHFPVAATEGTVGRNVDETSTLRIRRLATCGPLMGARRSPAVQCGRELSFCAPQRESIYVVAVVDVPNNVSAIVDVCGFGQERIRGEERQGALLRNPNEGFRWVAQCPADDHARTIDG